MEALNINWKEVRMRYRRDEEGLEQFIRDGKNKIATMLVRLTYEQNLVTRTQRRIETQKKVRVDIQDADELWGSVNLAITKVAGRWESYCRHYVTKGKYLKHASGGDLDLDSVNGIVGYFKATLMNEIADVFIKNSAQKREGEEVNMGVFDYSSEGGTVTSHYEDSIVSDDSAHKEIKIHIFHIIDLLRTIDKEQNTKMARVFAYFMNPRNSKTISGCCSKLKITYSTAQKHYSSLEEVLRNEFPHLGQELLSLYDQTQTEMDGLMASWDSRKSLKKKGSPSVTAA